jgi:hypothetical protein
LGDGGNGEIVDTTATADALRTAAERSGKSSSKSAAKNTLFEPTRKQKKTGQVNFAAPSKDSPGALIQCFYFVTNNKSY